MKPVRTSVTTAPTSQNVAANFREPNIQLVDVRREREIDFKDLSEVANSRRGWYDVAQIVVLIVTCTWQLRYLKVSFSIS